MMSPAHPIVDLWLSPEPVELAADQASHYANMLSAGETRRWQRFLHAADRDRFLHARALTRSILAGYLGDVAPATLAFSQGSWGKPTLAQPPLDQPLFFNLSHTRGMAVLAVTRAGEVGVDVENIERRVELLALSARYFAEPEHRHIAQLSDAAQREQFFRIWTLKEAYLKACGLGLRIALDSFAFECAHDYSAVQLHNDTGIAGHWLFQSLAHDKFRFAVALQQTAAVANTETALQLIVRTGQPGMAFTEL